MKGKWKIAAGILCAALLAGCQETPEEQIVRQKGEDSIKAYQEAEQTPAEDGAEEERTAQDKAADSGNGTAGEGDSKNGTVGEGDSQEGTAGEENPLAERLQVPARYTAEDSSEDGAYSMKADAKIQVPQTDHVSVWQVSIRSDAQEAVNQIQQAFFGDAPLYEGESYFQMTKSEIQKKLEELKGYQAAGNLDPYGYREAYQETANGASDPEALDEIYNIQNDIDYWQEMYEEAPEDKEKVETSPVLSVSEEDQAAGFTDGYFSGAVETDDGVYSVRYSGKHASDRIFARIQRLGEDGNNDGMNWNSGFYDAYALDDTLTCPSREEAEKMAGISEEEAIAMGNSYVEKLGDDGFVLGPVRLAVRWRSSSENGGAAVYDNGGYELNYIRKIDGVSMTYETNQGGGLESMDSTNDTSGYERLSIVVNEDGLQNAEMANWYTVGEKTVDDVEMLSFPEAASIFEQMMKMKNADRAGGVLDQSYEVKKVTLGYMRIYDPGKSVTEGLLVPVWDFFGVSRTHYSYNGEEGTGVNGDACQSLMTINAIDGTVIDRSLGY